MNDIKTKNLSEKNGGYDKPIHSARTDSNHTKHTSSILNTMHIPQYNSYIFSFPREVKETIYSALHRLNHTKHTF